MKTSPRDFGFPGDSTTIQTWEGERLLAERWDSLSASWRLRDRACDPFEKPLRGYPEVNGLRGLPRGMKFIVCGIGVQTEGSIEEWVRSNHAYPVDTQNVI